MEIYILSKASQDFISCPILGSGQMVSGCSGVNGGCHSVWEEEFCKKLVELVSSFGTLSTYEDG